MECFHGSAFSLTLPHTTISPTLSTCTLSRLHIRTRSSPYFTCLPLLLRYVSGRTFGALAPSLPFSPNWASPMNRYGSSTRSHGHCWSPSFRSSGSQSHYRGVRTTCISNSHPTHIANFSATRTETRVCSIVRSDRGPLPPTRAADMLISRLTQSRVLIPLATPTAGIRSGIPHTRQH